jgi:hypothetical protein
MAGPVEYPQNDFTRMIDMTSRVNAAGGGRGLPVHTGEQPPAVTSQAMREPSQVEESLSFEEKLRLDQLAREAGVQDERLGNVTAPTGEGSPTQDQYANMTMEEIIAMSGGAAAPAASPSVAPAPILTRQTRNGLLSGPVTNASPPARVVTQVVTQPPRLPNFRNVQGLDLITGEVFVDDMSFKMSPADLSEFRRYAVEVARAEIMKQLEEAMNLFTQETAEDEDGGFSATEEADAPLQPDAKGNRTQPAV